MYLKSSASVPIWKGPAMKLLAEYRFYFLKSLLLGSLLIAGGCREKSSSPVIARIGKSTLTLEDLNESIPDEYRGKITREQNIKYVKQWIDNELLYQEALRRKIHKEKVIKTRLRRMKRDLLCAEMISRNSVQDPQARVTEEMVHDYYEKNKHTFVRDQDVFKYMEIIVDDLKTAWQVRNLVRANNFPDLAARYSKLPVLDPRSLSYVPADEIPPVIAEVIPTIRTGGTTSPIKVNNGYSIIRVVDKQKAGTTSALEEIQDEIINRLSAELQKTEIENMLYELSQKSDVEFNMETIPEGEKPQAPLDSTDEISNRTEPY
ncbi:MAG: hypothetical protein GF401_11085 [Chitinivibrionales bacterium]|nr:hypothetical protein [Chitinivibrionales bacterium]